MGRTIPSFRIASVEELKEWKGDKKGRKVFDGMFFSCIIQLVLLPLNL
jgi:hypothetical protein